MEDVEGHLQRNRLHVGPLEGGGDVHVHLQEVAHLPTLLPLLRLQLGEQADEPLEALVLPVDPDEVHLPQVEHARVDLARPAVVAVGTGPLDLQVSVDDRLENGGKGGDADPSANQNRMFCPVDVA